ncbi:hypothetical protein ACFSUK_19315 [Sphingobium scionense]
MQRFRQVRVWELADIFAEMASTTPLELRLMSIARSRLARTPVTMMSASAFCTAASCACAIVGVTLYVSAIRDAQRMNLEYGKPISESSLFTARPHRALLDVHASLMASVVN